MSKKVMLVMSVLLIAVVTVSISHRIREAKERAVDNLA